MRKVLERMLRKDIHTAEAQLKMGARYEEGEDCLVDYVAAAQWYEKAAKQGDACAQYHLGQCYFSGAGVAQDFQQAQAWLIRAGEEIFLARRMLRQFYSNGALLLQPNFSNFPGLQARAARGEPAACMTMGNCFFVGVVGYSDYVAAVHWYQTAARNGDPEAQFCLGYAYTVGAGVIQDKSCGFDWFEKAAAQEFVPAIHNLSVCYHYGCGTEKSCALEQLHQERIAKVATGSAISGKLYAPEDLWYDRHIDELTKILHQPEDS